SASPTGAETRASPRSRESTLRARASSNRAAFIPAKPPRCCMSPIAPAIATPARSQFRSSMARARSQVVVAPHASRVPSMPTRATPLRTRSRSSFGTRSARLRAMAPASLHLELREGAGVVPVRGEDPLVLVVPREPADPGLDQLEPALVRQVRRVRRDVDLEVDGPLHEGAEVFRELPGQPLPREDLRDGLASREPDVRDRV